MRLSWRGSRLTPSPPRVLVFLCSTLFSQSRDKCGGGGRDRRESEVDNHYHPTCISFRSALVCSSSSTSPPPAPPPQKNIFISIIKQFFLHANPSKQAEANLRAWAASFFSGVPDSLADICPAVCGTQSSCPVSAD